MSKVLQLEDPVNRGRGRPRDEMSRKRILDAALELLEESGFAQVTTEAIADRAGSSKATIYRWWPNKAAVLIEAFREAVSPELPTVDSGCLRKDLREQLRNFVKMLTGRRGRIFAAVVAAAQSDPEVANAFRTIWVKPRRDEAKAVLGRTRPRTNLKKGIDLDVVLDLLYGPLYYRLLVNHGPLSAGYAESIADAALDGLLED